MPTTTRVSLLQLLSEGFGDWYAASTTSAGNAGGTTLVDSALLAISIDTDYFLNWYVRITQSGHAAEGQVRRVTAYSGSTGTLTVSSAFGAPTQIAGSIAYELHRFDPVRKHEAIKRASALSFPHLYLPTRDESLIVDDLLANSGYESAISGGAHPSWTNVGAGITVTAETTTVFHGAQSAKIVSGGGAAGQITQAPSVQIPELVGMTVTFKRMVWASAASVARLRLDWDGSDIDSGSYHTGDSQWRRLTVSEVVPSTATQIKAICEVATGSKTAYFDSGGDCGLFIYPIHKYTLPSAMVRGPFRVEQQVDIDRVNGPYELIQDYSAPKRGRILRLHGMNMLAQPTTDSGTVEIGAPRTELFVAFASRFLYRATMTQGSAEERTWIEERRRDWDGEISRLLNERGIRMPSPAAEIPRGTWHVEEDSSGRYLYMVQQRESVVTG